MLLKVASLFLIVVLLAGSLAAAQCAVACFQPAPPPCHHSPQKSWQTCDAAGILPDAPQLFPVHALPVTFAPEDDQRRAAAPLEVPPAREVHPPGTTHPLVLLI